MEGYYMDKVKCVEDGKVYRSKKEAMDMYNLSYTELRRALDYGDKVNGLHFHLVKSGEDEEDKKPRKKRRDSSFYSDAVRIKRLADIYETKSESSITFVVGLKDAIDRLDAEWVIFRSRDFMGFTDKATGDSDPFMTVTVEHLFRYVILIFIWWAADEVTRPTLKDLKEYLDSAVDMGADALLENLESIGSNLEMKQEVCPLEKNPWGFCDDYDCYQEWLLFTGCAGKARLAAVENLLARVAFFDWDVGERLEVSNEKNLEIQMLKSELEETRKRLEAIQKVLES